MRVAATRAVGATTRAVDATTRAITVVSFNVNGLRAILRRSPRILEDVCARTGADVLALQETKLGREGARGIPGGGGLEGYGTVAHATSRARAGYSGASAYVRDGFVSSMRDVRELAIGVDAFDVEGRALVVELDWCVVACAYAPNSGAELGRLRARADEWEPNARRRLNELRASTGKPIIYCGDLNVAHEEIDLWGRHAENSKSAGFTPDERASMTKLLDECSLVDTFRALHPNERAYSYWSYRGRARELDRGWRLDYVLADSSLRVVDAFRLPDVLGSDHCPVGATLALEIDE